MCKKSLILIPAVLLLAACSRNSVPASAQNTNPEPIDRTNMAANAPSGLPTSQPPQGMYASGQTVADQNIGQQPYGQAAPANSAYLPPPSAAPQSPYAPVQPGSGYADGSSYADRAAGQPAAPVTSTPEPVAPAPAPPQAAAYAQTTVAARTATESRTPAWDEPVLPAGTPLRVRLDESLGTKYDRSGMRFYATLAEPVMENGHVLVPAGTRFVGHLTESKPSGRLKGRAVIAVRLDAFQWRGREVAIVSSSIVRETRGHKGHDLKWIGGGGGLGALIGGIAGGGEGALIGVAAGAGAGTAGALVTGRKQLTMPAETPLVFRLRRPVQL